MRGRTAMFLIAIVVSGLLAWQKTISGDAWLALVMGMLLPSPLEGKKRRPATLAGNLPLACLAFLAFGACDTRMGGYLVKSARVEKETPGTNSTPSYGTEALTQVDGIQMRSNTAPTCASGKGCIYTLSSDGLIYTVDGNALTLKLHAAQSYRTSASCAGLSSPANGDVCYDTTIPGFRFYSAGWTTAPVDDSLLLHKAGTETITGVKTFNAAPVFGAGLTASGAVANDFSGSTGTFLTSSGANTLSGTTTIAANKNLVGAAGTGALTLGSMTGDSALPTGALSWAGAASKTLSLVGAAAFTLTGGATSVWSLSAGDLRVDAAGVLNLGTTAATSTTIGRSGQVTNALGTVQINSAPTVSTFFKTCTITSAAAATPVNCLSASDVPAALSAKLGKWHAYVNGATGWSTTTACVIEDTAGNDLVTIAIAALTANTFINDSSANVTKEARYRIGTGGAADAGLQISCDANGTGSDLVVTLMGTVQ